MAFVQLLRPVVHNTCSVVGDCLQCAAHVSIIAVGNVTTSAHVLGLFVEAL